MASEPPPSLAFSTVIAPLVTKFPKDQGKPLREAFVFAEKQNPGFIHDFVAGVIQNEDMTEILLRLGSNECSEYVITQNTELNIQLNKKAQQLRLLLSNIPDQIKDKSVFLQTIKDIAQSIKELLNCVNKFYQSNTNNPSVIQNKRLFDHHKKSFVRCSKAFSDSLRTFFKNNNNSIVFLSANKLITQTNVLMRTIKIIIEKG